MSKAAGRMADGRVQNKRGTRVGADSRQTYLLAGNSAWSRTRRTALLKVLDRQADGQKVALLVHLREQDTANSRALLAELEERWQVCLVPSI
jgi:hypothetical protein